MKTLLKKRILIPVLATTLFLGGYQFCQKRFFRDSETDRDFYHLVQRVEHELRRRNKSGGFNGHGNQEHARRFRPLYHVS